MKQPTRAVPSRATHDVSRSYNRTTRELGYLALGASGAALAATVAMGAGYLAARSRLHDHCPTPTTCDDEGVRAAGTAGALQVTTLTAGVAAVALGIGGIGLLAWSAPPSHTSALVPLGVTWHGVF